MPIPKHNEIRVPVLEYLKTHGSAGAKDMVGPLSQFFNLSPEEVSQMYESGKGLVFKDRIAWALTYLKMAGLVNVLHRGVYEITPKGIVLLGTPQKVDQYIDEQYAIREAKKNSREEPENAVVQVQTLSEVKEKLTPQEKLFQSYENIKKSVLEEILDAVLSKSPIAFEKLVISLLQKMGYGGEIKDSGILTKASNDHGIDGIIKKDILGLEHIYIQAKCYDRENGIGREHIQKFVGALAVMQSKNGIFITTSYFNKNALEYVKNLNGNPNLILMNGEELANYIYDYNLGMQTEQVITIKKLDSDFWDEMEDR